MLTLQYYNKCYISETFVELKKGVFLLVFDNMEVSWVRFVLEGALTSGALTSGALTSGALTSGALTSGALTSGALTSGALTSGALTRLAWGKCCTR